MPMQRKLGLVATRMSREPSAVAGRQRAIRSLVSGAPVWKLAVMIGVTCTTGNDFVVRNFAVETVT